MSPISQKIYRYGVVRFRAYPQLFYCNSEWVHARRDWSCVDCRRKIPMGEYYLHFNWSDQDGGYGSNYCIECAFLFGLKLISELSR